MTKIVPFLLFAAGFAQAGPPGTGAISGLFNNPSPACVAPPDTDPSPGAECGGIGANGTIVVASTVNSVDLALTSAGDSAPFNQTLTAPITIVQTPNIFSTPAENADFIYFTDHPEFGSFRVFEGAATTVQVIAKFNSLDLVGFGGVGDSAAGFVSSSITAVPEPVTVFLSGVALLGIGIALRCRTAKRPDA